MATFMAQYALAAGLIAITAANAFAAGETPANVSVAVIKARTACFSDQVRVTGFMVARREAHVVAQDSGRVTDVLVSAGDSVTANQELARISGATGNVSLRAPVDGLIIDVKTAAGAPAAPQAGAMFRIAIGGEIELNAEIPSMHLLKLNPGAVTRISRDHHPDIMGQVRLVSPVIDLRTQLGQARIALNGKPSVRIGEFARANIDAQRSCGVAVPRAAVDHATVQIVRDAVVQTRRVTLGLTSDTDVQILDGVSDGDFVVAHAGTSLHDGDRVTPLFKDEAERMQVR